MRMRLHIKMADKQRDKDDSVKFCRKQRSVVWKHFERKKKHSVCKLCGKHSRITEERATFAGT